MRKYLYSLDTGIGHLGLAIIGLKSRRVKYMRCILTESRLKESKAEGNVRRCTELARNLNNLLQRYPSNLFCAEIPNGGALSSSAMSHMSMATAFIATFTAAKGIELLHITPSEIKKLTGRKGSVSKDDVATYVERVLGVKVPTKKDIREHIADALGAYLVARTKFRSKFSNERPT